MKKNKDWKKYFLSQSDRMTKIVNALYSALIFLFAAVLIINIAYIIGSAVSEPGTNITLQSKGFAFFRYLFNALFFLCAIAFFSAVFYNYLTIKDKESDSKGQGAVSSPLRGKAEEHEEQIVALLKSVAQPSVGKQHLNRAATGQMLRALAVLDYMDANVPGANLKAWVEQVTGYKDKDTDSAHFFAAYKRPTKDDSKVVGYMQQIKQITGQ